MQFTTAQQKRTSSPREKTRSVSWRFMCHMGEGIKKPKAGRASHMYLRLIAFIAVFWTELVPQNWRILHGKVSCLHLEIFGFELPAKKFWIQAAACWDCCQNDLWTMTSTRGTQPLECRSHFGTKLHHIKECLLRLASMAGATHLVSTPNWSLGSLENDLYSHPSRKRYSLHDLRTSCRRCLECFTVRRML